MLFDLILGGITTVGLLIFLIYCMIKAEVI